MYFIYQPQHTISYFKYATKGPLLQICCHGHEKYLIVGLRLHKCKLAFKDFPSVFLSVDFKSKHFVLYVGYIACFCTRPIILDAFYIDAWLVNNGAQNALYKFCGGHDSPVSMPMVYINCIKRYSIGKYA